MMNKELLSAFGLLIGTGVLVVANGMDTGFASSAGDDSPVIGVAAGAPSIDRAAAMQIQLYECGQDRPQKSAYVPFEAAALAEFSALADLPVHTPGDHAFSEMSWEVEEGCYFVTAEPVDAADRPIDDCTEARTPDTFVDQGRAQRFALVSRCDRQVSEGIEVAGNLNRPPAVADMSVERIEDTQSCDTIEVCATARDRDADPMAMQWSVRTEEGNSLHLPAPQTRQDQRSEDASHLTECVEITPGKGRWSLEVDVRDQHRRGGRLVAYEDSYVRNWGLVAESSDTRAVTVEADCDKAQCPADPDERITDITYWITRDGRLLAPTSDLSRVRPGDMVDVEFEIADGCKDTQVTFASYTGEARAEQASVFSRSYDAGSHLLWNVLPECAFTADLHLGPPLSAEERSAADDPYNGDLLDSFAGGDQACGD